MAIKQGKKEKSHTLCTWRPASECQNCATASSLKCRFNWGDQLHFIGMFLTVAIPAIIGMLLGGFGWYLLGWLAFAIINFTFWEGRVLCSHCPYWAEDGVTLHCLANTYTPKVYKYHPEPMSRAEKIQIIIIFIILVGYPFPFLILSGQFIFAGLTAWGILMFFWTLQKYTCPKCINFSCPLNKVPKAVVDEYLEKNPVMKKAWERSGYKTGT